MGTFAAFLALLVSSIFAAALVGPSRRLTATFVRLGLRLAAAFVRPGRWLAATIVRPAHGLVAAIRVWLAVVRGSDGVIHVSCPGIGSLSRRRRTRNVVPVIPGVRWRVRSRLPGCHHSMAFEVPGLRSGSDGRPAMVYRGQQCVVPGCCVFVMRLFGGRYGMPLAHGSLFGVIWPHNETARAAVVANPIHGDVIDDSPVDVGRVNDGGVDVGHCGVVGKDPVIPVSADVIDTPVTVAIVNPAVEAYVRTPVSGMPEIRAALITPITRRPQKPDGRGFDPRAGHPIVAIRAISPIAGRPDLARTGANRLRIDRQDRRADVH